MGTFTFSRVAAAAAFVLTLAVTTGCATTTTIISNPPGATVSRNGQNLGTTPYAYTTDMNVLSSETVQVTAPSGEAQTVVLRRSEIDPLPFCATLGTCFVFGWTGFGLAGGVLYFFSGWKLPETTVVNFSGATAARALPPRPPRVARRDDVDDGAGDRPVAMPY